MPSTHVRLTHGCRLYHAQMFGRHNPQQYKGWQAGLYMRPSMSRMLLQGSSEEMQAVGQVPRKCMQDMLATHHSCPPPVKLALLGMPGQMRLAKSCHNKTVLQRVGKHGLAPGGTPFGNAEGAACCATWSEVDVAVVLCPTLCIVTWLHFVVGRWDASSEAACAHV
jgi:hypothetical protein